MRFLRPTPPKNSRPTIPTTFGEKRAQDLQNRYEKAQAERQKLVRAQYASEGDLKETYAQKAFQTERKIDTLAAQLKPEENT